jgi:hypothetical protein
MSHTIKYALLVSCAVGFAAVALTARGQSTTRPGEPTLARVWVENRSANETIPVAIESTAAPLRVQLDPSVTVRTRAGRQGWEYRSLPLASGADPGKDLAGLGNDGWEAIGVLQSGAAGATVLLKRPL